MKTNDILYSKGKNDECLTPEYAVLPILKYIPKNKVVWCPFDNENSNFVKVLQKNNVNVIHSHIVENKDFYNYEPREWDLIVSNPPFTNKRKIFERALTFNKPFALIMSNMWLNDSAPIKLFNKENKDLQLLMFDKRIYYENNGIVQTKIPFSSSYFCYNFLPKNLITEIIERV